AHDAVLARRRPEAKIAPFLGEKAQISPTSFPERHPRPCRRLLWILAASQLPKARRQSRRNPPHGATAAPRRRPRRRRGAFARAPLYLGRNREHQRPLRRPAAVRLRSGVRQRGRAQHQRDDAQRPPPRTPRAQSPILADFGERPKRKAFAE